MRALRRLALDLILDPTVHMMVFAVLLGLYFLGREPWRVD